MKTLTKEERREIYLRIATNFSVAYPNSEYMGMCYHLKEALVEMGYDHPEYYHQLFKKTLPEFLLMYPPNLDADGYWHIENSDRAIIMCLCAAMCN